jgi:hypothetical protein
LREKPNALYSPISKEKFEFQNPKHCAQKKAKRNEEHFAFFGERPNVYSIIPHSNIANTNTNTNTEAAAAFVLSKSKL